MTMSNRKNVGKQQTSADGPTDKHGAGRFNSAELTGENRYCASHKETEIPFAGDLVDFLEFQTSDLTDTDQGACRVMKRIDHWASVVGNKFRRKDIVPDLAQEMRIALRYQSNYSGERPLDVYILKAMKRLAVKLTSPQVPPKSKPVKDKTATRVSNSSPRFESIDDESSNLRQQLRDTSSEKLQDRILAAIYFDKRLLELRDKSDLHTVVEQMVRARVRAFFEGEQNDESEDDIQWIRLTDRRIACLASKQLGKEITRYQAAPVLAEFKQAFELVRA
jgi:hypothetical protein